MILETPYRDRPTAVTTAVALALIVGISGVVVAGAHGTRPAFAAHEAARMQTSSTPPAEVAPARDPLRARIERFSGSQAKQFYLGCSSAALRGELDGDETAMCSIGYDVLLKRHFNGDFHRLLAWSRSQPHRRDGAWRSAGN